jgi:hypothetical protein
MESGLRILIVERDCAVYRLFSASAARTRGRLQ